MDGSTQGNGPEAAGAPPAQAPGKERERSSIAFPYYPMADAIGVARAVHSNVGTGGCTDDQLSAWLDLSQRSSGYRVRIYAARMFGLIEAGSDGQHVLTPLGRQIVDPDQVEQAKAESFLKVPLYREMFDRFRGNSLPPPAALEREFVALGVAQKQTSKARSAFEKSAETAGYFAHGRNRLVKPGFSERPDKEKGGTGEQEPPHSKTGGNGGGGTYHPFIDGLLKELPSQNDEWAISDRVKWLRLAASAFDMIYRGSGEIEIRGKDTESLAPKKDDGEPA